jgi:membrane protein implicated in regulation of membrane protease activity
MRTFYRLSEDRTVRISHATGLEGTVYLSIPGDKAGAGKIHLNLQGRLMEYEAVTATKAGLPAGARVVVVGARGSSTLEVEPLPEQATQEART